MPHKCPLEDTTHSTRHLEDPSATSFTPKNTNMHHCLHVTEIVELITQFTEVSSKDSNQCLTVSLSQVCKAFYEPALNVHWRSLETLRPLMACFPDDVCEEDEKQNYHFKRNPSPQDWKRFQHHARRVRILHCSDDNLGIGAAEYHILDTCRPDRSVPLLPHLRELYWDDFRTPVAPFVRLFIQPSLTMFHIISVSNPRLIAQFIRHLVKDAPFLRHLRIRSPGSSATNSLVTDTLASALPRMRYLIDVSIRAKLNEIHLMELATLPNLEVLCAPLDSEVDVARLFADQKDSFFPSLSRLDVTAARIGQVASLIHAVSSRTLNKVGTHLETQPSSSALQDYFQVVSQHPSVREVSVLMLSARPPDRSLNVTSNDFVLGGETLRPLLRLRDVRRLYMVQFPFRLTDDFLREAAGAWSCLESLTLGTMVRSRTSGVTLEGLRPLADQCKTLRELAIAVDIVPHKMTTKEDPVYSGESSLKTFDIGSTSVPEDERLVQFVADVFPHANICDTQGSLDNGRKRLLEKLNSGIARTQDGDSSE